MNKMSMFISSTVNDLTEERNAVERLVTQLGGLCWRSETYVAPGKSAYEACVEMAKKCDVFIGVYGQRYGYVDSVAGKSVTEMEYDAAFDYKPRKILIYIKDISPREKEQLEFLRKVQNFRNGYFRHKFFSSTRELKNQLKVDLLAWITERVQIASQLESENAVLRAALRTKDEFLETVIREYALPFNIK